MKPASHPPHHTGSALLLAACLAAGSLSPAFAQDGALPEAGTGDSGGTLGTEMMDRLESLGDELGPSLEELGRSFDEQLRNWGWKQDWGATLQALGPMLRDLAGIIHDAEDYYPPEELPNGDVLIRRRPEAEPPGADDDPPAPPPAPPPEREAPEGAPPGGSIDL